MNKNYIWVFAGLFMLTLISAAWVFTIDGSTTGNVTSTSEYSSLSLNIPSLTVNTTNGADSDLVYSDDFVINKNMTVSVSINETFTDDSNGTCSNGQSDCSLVYKIANSSGSVYTEIQDLDNISIIARPQVRNITVEMSCVAYSCPQSRSIDILLTQVG